MNNANFYEIKTVFIKNNATDLLNLISNPKVIDYQISNWITERNDIEYRRVILVLEV